MSKKSEKILVFSLFALTLGIRIAFITQKNLWFDEVFSWHLSLDSFYEIIVRTSADIHPPLYYWILKIWSFFFGDSVFAIRLLSALFTSSAVFFIYPLAKRVMSPLNAVLVLVLYSVSPLNLYYSQEARMSAMNLFLNAGSAYFLLALADKLKFIGSDYRLYMKKKEFWLYAFFTAAALLTHYFSFFLLLAQLIYLYILYRNDFDKYKPFLIAYNFVIAAYLFWIPPMLEHLTKGQSWRTPQTIYQVSSEYLNYIKDLNLGLYYHYTNLSFVKYVSIAYLVIILISIAGYAAGKFFREKDKSIILIVVSVFIPLILAGVISFRQKVEFYRYLSIIVPFILIFLVYGISKFDKKYITLPLVGFIFLINVFGVNLHYSFDFKNDDYRRLINTIENEYIEGDRIYVEPHYYGWLIDYYKKQNKLQIPKTTYIRYGWSEVLDSLNTQKPDRFWVVFDYSAVDTTKYDSYISGLNSKYSKDFYSAFYTAPYRIDLYRYSQK